MVLLLIYLFLSVYLSVGLFIWLCVVLVSAHGIFIAPCRISHCDAWISNCAQALEHMHSVAAPCRLAPQ